MKNNYIRTKWRCTKNPLPTTHICTQKTTVLKLKKNDVKIVTTRNIENGKLIKTLCDQTAIIKSEDIKVCFA